MSSPIAIEGLQRSVHPGTTREQGGEGRARLWIKWFRARAPRPLNPSHYRPEMTDTHGGPEWLGDYPLFCLLRCSSKASQPNTPNTHTTTPRLRPRLPHGTVTSGLQPATDDHFRFLDSIWRSQGTSGSLQVPSFTFVGHYKKVRGPKQ